MANKDRSVIERLEDIEKKIPSFETLPSPKPLSEVIGMPFEDYLNKSTVYGIEEDERKFKQAIKKQTKMPIACLCIVFLGFIIHIITLLSNKGNEWMLLIVDILAALCPIMALLILGKQKSKQPMKSFWNIKNIEFYLAPKGASKQVSYIAKNSFWFYAITIAKIVSIPGCGVLTFLYFLFGLQTIHEQAIMFWLSCLFGYLAFGMTLISLRIGIPYTYRNYIFETEDSYVTYPHLDYFKKQ